MSPVTVAAVLSVLLAAAVADAQFQLPAPAGWPVPPGKPPAPGGSYSGAPVGVTEVAAGAPRIFEHTADAGPDETCYLVGERLTSELSAWGAGRAAGGQAWPLKTHLASPGSVFATVPEGAADGPLLVWAKNEAGWSRPIRLNAPQLWWVTPNDARPGTSIRLFGRDLARRPDRTTAFVWLVQGDQGRWLPVERAEKYTVTVALPLDLPLGDHELWVHAGRGGEWGWSGPVKLTVANRISAHKVLSPPPGTRLQPLLDSFAGADGEVRLAPGVYPLEGTLRVPAGVQVKGAGIAATRLQLDHRDDVRFCSPGGARWNEGPGRVHSVNDTMEYELEVPAEGTWSVWLRYATDMAPWGQPGVSGNMTLAADDGEPVPLENLANTGSFGTFKWARSAQLKLAKGRRHLTWRNRKGGGINLDAFVFALDAAYTPSDEPLPVPSDKVLVLQGEDVVRFTTREGVLPGSRSAVVWLAGDGAELRDLTVSGTPQATVGVLVQHPQPQQWVSRCRLERVRVTDLEGKDGENMAVHLAFAQDVVVRNCELWGRAPLFFSGLRQAQVVNNQLVSVTRFGGNAEAAILGRCEVMEECVIEGNTLASPPGAEAGGPTARRLIWVSTGRGSITHNWFGGNGTVPSAGPGARRGAGPMRHGGVAGTDQNVGEMILFEGNHRTMYFGPLAAATADSVTLPKTVPATLDNRLGSVKRTELAHDQAGHETPFWPPDGFDRTPEPPIHEYYVTVFSGRGQGQSRRVRRREGERLVLAGAWREPPGPGSVVAVGTAFYQNLIVANQATDGMTGIQLWISCIENVAAANSIARQRRPAFYLYANGTTLASSMPRTWNRGLSPLFFNHIEGNYAEECSDGALVTSGDDRSQPIEFPRALGNVLRHNSFVRNRHHGVVIVSRKGSAATGDRSPSIAGTIVEFTQVRDAETAFHLGDGGDQVVFRRNHAYFWYPVSNSPDKPVGFAIDPPGAHVVMSDNNLEGTVGEEKPGSVTAVKRTGP